MQKFPQTAAVPIQDLEQCAAPVAKSVERPLLTCSFRTVPTRAESPSNPFRMSQASTATNTRRLPENSTSPAQSHRPEKLARQGGLRSIAHQHANPRLSFPPRCSQTWKAHPPLALPTNADDPLFGSLARSAQLPLRRFCSQFINVGYLTRKTSRPALRSSRCDQTPQASPGAFPAASERARSRQPSRSLIQIPLPS
jgi:hypothetical protein